MGPKSGARESVLPFICVLDAILLTCGYKIDTSVILER